MLPARRHGARSIPKSSSGHVKPFGFQRWSGLPYRKARIFTTSVTTTPVSWFGMANRWKVVQARLGHAGASETLDTYSHLWPDSEDRTRQAVDAVVEANSGGASVPL